MVDIPENIIEDFDIPNEVNINDINDPIFFDEYKQIYDKVALELENKILVEK